jgi:signal transduction histidine kinase
MVRSLDDETFWITLTMVLNLAVVLGSVWIAARGIREARALRPGPARSALATMRNLFLVCVLCGYLLVPISTFWPGAWRLDAGVLAVLACLVWRSALGPHGLQPVYNELRKTERLTRDLEEKREESQRKSLFLNAICHDLRASLNGLMLQVELAELQSGANDSEALGAALTHIQGCARTTADLLVSLMEIGRLDWSDSVTAPTPLDLGDLLQTIAARYRPRAAQKGLALHCAPAPRMLVETDRVKVERILSNLLDNAIKFTRTGSIEIIAEVRRTDAAVCVCDTGEGIAVAEQTTIFDDFYQVGAAERGGREGFGLGLAIARRLARLLLGDLTVESDPGRGSCFTLTLPLASVPHRHTLAGAGGATCPTAVSRTASVLG